VSQQELPGGLKVAGSTVASIRPRATGESNTYSRRQVVQPHRRPVKKIALPSLSYEERIRERFILF
jgi:hypothetical protein